ncbi:helix-turn-helix domain-containing protein [Paenibacillus filicis]|uniref:Helix-turn-helix domain-containing protein n=1 Tax=Paenibacillus filicis TaxID=669464 RepID=A0ABU9DWR0_9BACL
MPVEQLAGSEHLSAVRRTVSGIDPGRLIVRVTGIDLFTGVDGDELEQQLTVSAAVIIPVSGSGQWVGATGRYRIRPDHAYLCPPGGTLGLTAEKGGELSVYMVRLDCLQLQDPSRYPALITGPEFTGLFGLEDEARILPPGQAAALCRDIHEGLESADGLERMRAQLKGTELVYLILAADRECAGGGTAEALQRSKAYIDHCYKEDISIDLLASMAEVSPKYYVELFKKTYGTSALDYLTKVRLDRAKQLMLQTDLRLRDIAHSIGYGDEFYFSRKFKKIVGESPSSYMKKRARKIAAYGSASVSGYLLALGVMPYSAPLHPKWSGYYCDRYGADIPVHLDAYRHNHYKEANLKKLAHAKPELIIGHFDLEEWEKERLSEIAPLYLMPRDGLGWRWKLRELAVVLGDREEAECWIDDFEQKLKQQRDRIGQLRGQHRLVVLKLLKDQLYACSCYSYGELLYHELGLPMAYPQDSMEFSHPLSTEDLDNIDADHMLLMIRKESETLDYWKKLRSSEAWISLRAVRDNKIRLIASEPWREYSPIALARMLEETEELLSGNDPS